MSEPTPVVITSFDQYQKAALATAVYSGCGTSVGFTYTLFGLFGEAGEVLNKHKKVYRDRGGVWTDADRQRLAKELGGVSWYVAAAAAELGAALHSTACRDLYQIKCRSDDIVDIADIADYQAAVFSGSDYPAKSSQLGLDYVVLLLASAAGRVITPYVRFCSGEPPKKGLRRKLCRRLGVVLRCVSLVASEAQLDLAVVMQTNVDELSSRQARGTLHGSGDDR